LKVEVSTRPKYRPDRRLALAFVGLHTGSHSDPIAGSTAARRIRAAPPAQSAYHSALFLGKLSSGLWTRHSRIAKIGYRRETRAPGAAPFDKTTTLSRQDYELAPAP
jgi:hypothetical protein